MWRVSFITCNSVATDGHIRMSVVPYSESAACRPRRIPRPRHTRTFRHPATPRLRESGTPPEGEALRDDEKFSYVAAWEYAGAGKQPILNKEPLTFEYVHPSQRSYK